MNLSPLALSCSRILLVQGGVYCLPCNGGLLAYLASFSLSSAKKISQQQMNHQPLRLEMGTSPLLPVVCGHLRPNLDTVTHKIVG